MIDIWYGEQQQVGQTGLSQQWFNVLGSVPPAEVRTLSWSLNGGPWTPVAVGPDGHRLAHAGDFNVEVPCGSLRPGANVLLLAAADARGRCHRRQVDLHYTAGGVCPLPHTVRWSGVRNIGDAAQVVDGRWRLTPAGVRTVAPYYDRAIGVGDLRWADYQVTTTVTFHGIRVPRHEQGDAGAQVMHAALAVRWPGHAEDGRRPRVQWYPLGATAEFRVEPGWQRCSWRILGGAKIKVEASTWRAIEPERPYAMQHRVVSTGDGGARYSVRLWPAGVAPPEAWDLELVKPQEEVPQGGALLLAHYTDVTFGDVRLEPA